jgi:taurine dioxygenase
MSIAQKVNTASEPLAVRRLAGRIGAEISGVTLRGDLGARTVAAIRQALLEHKVVFFRNQAQLSVVEQEAFGRLFGTLVPHPTLPKMEGTETALDLVYTDAKMAASEWHTDDPYIDAYAGIGILHAITLPSLGGDTLWANTATAYEQLPEPLRDLAGKLWVLHANTYDVEDAVKNRADAPPTVYQTEHPLVRVHPETGERTLLLGYFAQKFIGLNRQDSARLIGIFQDHITRPENTVRWHWAPGDVALWDNRATQHYGIGDFNEKRHLHRVSVQGDVPVSIDGRRSVMRR